jgi:hypothetical protein
MLQVGGGGHDMADPKKLNELEVTVFSVPSEKGESTLRAVEAMNDASGGDLMKIEAETLGASTVSGTRCSITGELHFPLPDVDYNCADADS